MPSTTITLELLAAAPPLYRQLKATRQLHPTLTTLAAEFVPSRREWTESLMTAGHDPQWVSATATEFALAELNQLVAQLRAAVLPDEPRTDGEPTPDGAMAFLRSATPPE